MAGRSHGPYSRRRVRRALAITVAALLVTVAALAGAQSPGLEGRWLVFDSEGEARFVGEVSGTRLDFLPLRPADQVPPPFTMVPGPVASSYRLQEAGSDRALLFLQSGGRRATILDVPGGTVEMAYRLGEVAAELVGAWTLQPPGSGATVTLTIEAGGATTIVLPDLTSTGTAEGFPMPAPGPCVAIAFPGEPFQPLCFVPAGEGAWLVAPPGEDDFAVAFREGAPPPWLDQLRPVAPMP